MIAAKDLVGAARRNYEKVLDVPRIDEESDQPQLSHPGRRDRKGPHPEPRSGPFVIGAYKVRPRMDETFKRSEAMGLYLQLYNFEPDQKTHKADGSIEYEIVKDGSSEAAMLKIVEDLASLPGAASQMVVEKPLPLSGLAPGHYTLKIRVTTGSATRP